MATDDKNGGTDIDKDELDDEEIERRAQEFEAMRMHQERARFDQYVCAALVGARRSSAVMSSDSVADIAIKDALAAKTKVDAMGAGNTRRQVAAMPMDPYTPEVKSAVKPRRVIKIKANTRGNRGGNDARASRDEQPAPPQLPPANPFGGTGYPPYLGRR